MSILNLQKNDILDLTKTNPGLKNLLLGAGWDVAKKGLFGLGADCDLDLVAILLDENDKLLSKDALIYFRNKENRGIRLHGDNLTGKGDGDDENISISLDKLPDKCNKVVFSVCIYEAKKRRQSFSQVKNAYIRLLDIDKNNEVVCIYNLSKDGGNKTAVIFSELYRENGSWKFKAVGESIDASVITLAGMY